MWQTSSPTGQGRCEGQLKDYLSTRFSAQQVRPLIIHWGLCIYNFTVFSQI